VITRLLVLLAVVLGALALSAVPSANLGNLAGVDVARAQVPVDPNSDDSALDDTAVGGLDQTDLSTPVDGTDQAAPPAATPPPAAPPATTPPAPAAPAPTNAAPPVVTAPGTRTGSNGKWVRIRVRVGDTVRKIAARRGHPEYAAAIVKRNKTVRGKRKLRSSRTLLRHRRGATKATRKKDRLKLWVPAS
jgi:biotin carboxyl carrier protein